MRAGITLRADYTAEHLRVLARRSRDTGQTRRLLALAVIYEGGSRGDPVDIGRVTLMLGELNRRFERHLDEARLPPGKTLATFDFTAVPMVSKAQVMALAAGDSWLEKGAFGTMVAGRSPVRPEDENHPPLGQTRQPSFGSARSENQIGLAVRRHLPCRGHRPTKEAVPLLVPAPD